MPPIKTLVLLSVFFFFFFNRHFRFVYMKLKSYNERKRERGRETFQLLVHCSDDCHGQGWDKMKAETPSKSPRRVVLVQLHCLSSTAFHETWAGSCTRTRAAGKETNAHAGCAITTSSTTCFATMLVPIPRSLATFF